MSGKNTLFILSKLAICLACIQILETSCWAEKPSGQQKQAIETVKKKNLLGKEKSPYLLQHKDNPVHWFPWGKQAFEAAKKENKPIFLSIGYSTCYWCHVMEKDSFEIQEVADVLNEHFISIKIDREERPDIDQIYMDAVMALTGHGGWPMSVFLTPDLKPFYGGTFFKRAQFIQILEAINQGWEQNPTKVLETAEKIMSALKARGNFGTSEVELKNSILLKALSQLKASYDADDGGFGGAPKFPQSDRISLLFRIHRRNGDKSALEMASSTLDKMARGGIYDHLAGGFSRYSTDKKWLVPHFEKMLYDNALLATAYFEGYQATKNEMFKEVGREILDYVLRDMTDKQGGFYSAEDAGEVDEEGEFYVWTNAELEKILDKDQLAAVSKTYNISGPPNFEGKYYILHLNSVTPWTAKKDPILKQAEQNLLAARAKRERPHLDDKILTAWNGLMITAMATGFQTLEDKKYLTAATRSAKFIKEHLYRNGTLYRRFRDGEPRYAGYLEDYAYLIQGLITLYQSDFNSEWLAWAQNLQKEQDERFWDTELHGYFFSNPDDASIINRKKVYEDNATPSANGVAIHNLLRLHALTYNDDYLDKAKLTLNAMSGRIDQYSAGYSSALIALDFLLDRSKEVVVVGHLKSKTALEAESFINSQFLPNVVLALGDPAGLEDESALPVFRGKVIRENKTTFYVCENGSCQLPTTELEKMKQLVTEYNKY